VVSFSKRATNFTQPQNSVSATQPTQPVRRPRGRPRGSTNAANQKRALEDKIIPPTKRARHVSQQNRSSSSSNEERSEKENKRTIHNALERSRRNQLNELQLILKNQIPILASKAKASRASVLEEAEKYVLNMAKRIEKLKDKTQELKLQNNILAERQNSLITRCNELGIPIVFTNYEYVKEEEEVEEEEEEEEEGEEGEEEEDDDDEEEEEEY